MDRNNFLEAALAQPDLPSQLAMAREAIRRSLEPKQQVADSPDPLWLRQVRGIKALHLQLMQTLEDEIAASAADPVARDPRRPLLIFEAVTAWKNELKRMRFAMRHRAMRRNFREEHLGAAPLRDAEHEALRMVAAKPQSLPTRDGRRHDFAAVEPFIDHHASRRAREAAYGRWVRAGRIEPQHLRCPQEAKLLGQRGVFAVRDIPAGTCVGVYAGQLMDAEEVFLLRDDSYLMGVPGHPAGVRGVNGEGLLSLSNTRFLYGDGGQPEGHPDTGYELEYANFPVALPDGSRIGMPAFFTLHDIPAGTELRWNYELGKLPP